jgi:hypothetical protein
MIGLARLRYRYPHTSGALLLPAAIAASWLLMAAPALLAPSFAAESGPALVLSSGHGRALSSVLQAGTGVRALAALAGITLAAMLFDRLRRDLRTYPCDPARWRLQAALGALGSVAGIAPALWGG